MRQRANMRHRAKFRGDLSNRCWDTAIYLFFQYGGRPPSWICCERVWTTHEEHLVVCRPIFVHNNMDDFRFRPFGLKMSIYAPKLGVFGDLTPK